MSKLVVRRDKPSRYRLPRSNHMTFPRELRDAIPDLPAYGGRVLQLDSLTGVASRSILGDRVSLKLLVRETGKLKGKYTILMDLQPDAARHLAGMLLQLADQAGPIHSKM
jgi:hypothetical protein